MGAWWQWEYGGSGSMVAVGICPISLPCLRMVLTGIQDEVIEPQPTMNIPGVLRGSGGGEGSWG